MLTSITDYLGYLVYNMDLLPNILYSLELCYGLLGFIILLHFLGAIPYRLLNKMVGKKQLTIFLPSAIILQWIIIQKDTSGWSFIVTLFLILFVFVTKTILESFNTINAGMKNFQISLGAYNPDKVFQSYIRSCFLKFLTKYHIFILGVVVFSETLNVVSKGIGSLLRNVYQQFDIGLSSVLVTVVVLIIGAIHLLLHFFASRTGQNEEVI